MFQRTIRILIPFALAVASATIALAQSSSSNERLELPTRKFATSTWELAHQVGPSRGKIFVVTLDQPQRRQTCRIQSFTLEKLVCLRAIGEPRTFLPEQVLALILPSDDGLRLRLVLAFTGGSAAAIWGTVVLAATCRVCAVATGVAALGLFAFAGGLMVGDDQPERAFYLAPGQQLTGKLRFVQP